MIATNIALLGGLLIGIAILWMLLSLIVQTIKERDYPGSILIIGLLTLASAIVYKSIT